MFSSFRRRDFFLITLLAVVGGFLIAVGWFGAGQLQKDLIREQARAEAVAWGEAVTSRLSDPDATFAYGKITEEDQELIALIGQAGSVFRYKFFNQDGVIVLASRLSDLGKRETAPNFKNIVQRGGQHIEVVTERFTELEGKVDGTPTVTEAFIPLMENGRFKGAIEVYIDTTRQTGLLGSTLDRVKWLLVLVVSMFGLVVALIIQRNLKDRNREVETISRAHESLAKAETEVLQLNEDLEQRVEERTGELARANEDIKRLNEDLERRVEERTEQLNKTNEQLYRAVETANKINESLEQRVGERTAELNKANESMMRMNAELEQRVAERTSEVNRAYDDIRQLNSDLERRVDERTSDLARANEDIQKLNSDLERRVEERTADLGRANEDIQKLNTDLERRVEERTAELAEANKSIQDLNTDLEHRVEERTEELREAQQGLLSAERLAALGQLTATVSHELRNPLGAIRTAVYLIATMTQGKGLGIEDALQRAERSIGRCDSIINELLDFTRQTPLALEETTFDDWIDQVLDEQKVPDTISLRRDFQTEGTRLSFDKERLRRVMINLVGNACEAMKEQAETGGYHGEYVLDVSTRTTDDKLEVMVRDTGPGIEPDKLEKIFEPLFSTKSFGVGLGLPIVRQIIEQHGGAIEVSSELGRGTTFKLWVPTDLGKDGATLDADTRRAGGAERAA